MRKAALVAAGTLVLPLVLSLPAAAKGPIERAQDEGMRQARQASQKQPGQLQAKQLGSSASGGAATTGVATTGAAPSEHSQAQPFGMAGGSSKGGK